VKILLLKKRLSFPQIWTPASVGDDPDSKKAYSCNLLIDPDDPQVDELNDVIDQVAAEHWKEKAKPMLAALRGADRVCIHNGDMKAQYDAYPGNWYVSARNNAKPLILDRDKRVLTEADGRPYGGCYVNASLDIWVQDPKGAKAKHGKRINATLRGLQFVDDGDAFAGGAPANPDEFDDLGVDSSALA
jgi:hypothetical protein